MRGKHRYQRASLLKYPLKVYRAYFLNRWLHFQKPKLKRKLRSIIRGLQGLR